MLRRLERIDHSDASPGKSVLKILAEEQATLLVSGYGKDQRVPDRHLVIRREIKRRAHCVKRGIGDLERIGPTQDGRPCVRRRAAGFTDKYAVQLSKCLDRDYDKMPRQARDKIARGLATPRIPCAFGVGQYIGIERDPGHLAYLFLSYN